MHLKHFLQTGLLAATLAAGAAQAQNVVLYSSNNTETIETALDAVKKQSPKLNVQPVTGGTGTMMKRIEAEAQNPRGDLFWSGGFGTLGAYRQHLQPYRPADIDKIPAEFRGPDDLWVGTNVHIMVLMVNERQLKGLAAPATWSDLMQPQWKGKFAITDPSKSGTAYMLVYGLYKQFGQEGLDKIAANAVVTASSGTTYKGVAAGEYAVGMTLEYAAQEYVAGGQKEIKLVYPTEGSYLAPEGMFIIKGAKNLEAAKALYDGLLSKEAQEAQLVKNFRRPTRSDIAVASLTPPARLQQHQDLPGEPGRGRQGVRSRRRRLEPGRGQGQVRSAPEVCAKQKRHLRVAFSFQACAAGAGRNGRSHPAYAAMRPAASTTCRPQRAASWGSCVTSTSVVPCSRCRSNIRSMTVTPVAASRLPVGSSANSRSGCTTNARASDTRCCSPPDRVRG